MCFIMWKDWQGKLLVVQFLSPRWGQASHCEVQWAYFKYCLPKRGLCCCTVVSKKVHLFWKSLRIYRIGLRKLKKVMVLGRNMSPCVFHRRPRWVQPVCLPDIYLGNNVFVIVVVTVVALNPYPLVSPFVRPFLESPSHGDPRGTRFSQHLESHTSTAMSWLGRFPQYLAIQDRFQNVDAVTKQCIVLVTLY